jgi:transcriptional regulator with GAF, ATPase, and Fis domain
MVGRTPRVALLDQINQVAATNSAVLVTGETGTGKELVARAVHRQSRRRDKPLVIVNCAALTPTLVETELFGHERGAFTGATSRRVGRFELADRGTIFLDEVGELPEEIQVKLLRVLQSGEVERLGSTETCGSMSGYRATNRNLEGGCGRQVHAISTIGFVF